MLGATALPTTPSQHRTLHVQKDVLPNKTALPTTFSRQHHHPVKTLEGLLGPGLMAAEPWSLSRCWDIPVLSGRVLRTQQARGHAPVLDPRDPLLQSERTQGFTAGPVYGRMKCMPMWGSLIT